MSDYGLALLAAFSYAVVGVGLFTTPYRWLGVLFLVNAAVFVVRARIVKVKVNHEQT